LPFAFSLETAGLDPRLLQFYPTLSEPARLEQLRA
jgi:hypothetical protein